MRVFPGRHFGFRAVFAVLALLFAFPSHAETDPLLGFQLSLSKKRAFERAAEIGLETLEEGDKKDERKVVVFSGAAVDIFTDSAREVRTRVTFFKDKIEAVALLASSVQESDALAVERFVVSKYGEPAADEEIFSYRVKSWDLADEKVVFSYSRGGAMKLDHTHLPTRKERYERSIKRKKIKDLRPPVQRVIDGDYSKPDNLP